VRAFHPVVYQDGQGPDGSTDLARIALKRRRVIDDPILHGLGNRAKTREWVHRSWETAVMRSRRLASDSRPRASDAWTRSAISPCHTESCYLVSMVEMANKTPEEDET
jgi:hypothetical protein